MFSLVRSGPKTLVFESSRIQELKHYLTDAIGACEYDIGAAFDKAGEGYTIIFITDKLKDVVDIPDIRDILMAVEEPDVVLCRIMNDGKADLISRARIAPRIIILRAMGDMEKVVEEIRGDYKCTVGSLFDILGTHNEKGTMVALTDKPIHKTMSLKDIYERVLFMEERYYPLLKSLRSHALKYLNTGIGNKDWYEIEIRIFDRYSAYKLHYGRLLNIIENLELGIILGESWGKDRPRPMMSVEVYRVRFFTFYSPAYIKKILLGMEYLEDGTRIIDYDIYCNRRKLDWTEAVEAGIRSRHLLGIKYREEILSKLSETEKVKMHMLEESILHTRI